VEEAAVAMSSGISSKIGGEEWRKDGVEVCLRIVSVWWCIVGVS
jgi:hypothetical protein